MKMRSVAFVLLFTAMSVEAASLGGGGSDSGNGGDDTAIEFESSFRVAVQTMRKAAIRD